MHLRALALAFGCLTVLPSAFSQALLKLQGSQFAPIRQKSLDLRATVDGPVATTVLNMTYFNPAHARTEADFVFTVPEGSVVTGFAYWYKRERVVARIVDKERAAQIYSAIKTFRRDPALVELVGKRTFRARIFPVEQRSDLKIEMTVVSTARNGSFTFPVKVAKDQPIESAHVVVEGLVPSGTNDVVNNFGAPSTFDGRRYKLQIEGRQWRPDRDLKVGLKSRNESVKVMGVSARGTGPGFFTLLVSADSALTRPRITLSGVRTGNVHVEPKSRLAPGETLLVTGRTYGQGRLQVGLQGTGFSKTASIVLVGSGNKTALSRLWAQDEIEALGKAPSNEPRVRSLSKQYLLPSPYTSWLAIPEAERKNFELEIRAANAVVLATKLSDRLKQGASFSSVRAQLLAKIGKEPRDVRDQALGVLSQTAYDIIGVRTEAASKAWAKRIRAGQAPGERERSENRALASLARKLGIGNGQYSIDGTEAVRALSDGLAEKVMTSRIDEKTARRETGRLKAWYVLGEPRGSWKQMVVQANQEAIIEYEREVLAQGRESDRALKIKSGIRQVAEWMEGDTKSAYAPQIFYEAQDVARDLAAAQMDGQGDSAHAKELERRLVGFGEVFPWFNAQATIKQKFTETAHTRLVRSIPDLGRSVRRGGLEDPEVRSKLETAERYRALAGSKTPIGEMDVYLWSEPAVEIVAEARGKMLSGEPVEAVRDEVARQRNRIETAKFTRMVEELDKRLLWQLDAEAMGIAMQRWRADPDDRAISEHERAIRAFAELLGRDAGPYLTKAQSENYYGDGERWAFLKELRKQSPDPEAVSKLREDFRDANADWRGQEWIQWRIDRIETDALLDKLEKLETTPELERQIAELQKKSEELHARMGDPTLSVDLPAGTLRAEARFPWNVVQPLQRNPLTGRWEAKFDVPLTVRSGRQTVEIVGVTQDGKSVTSTWTFTVDLTAPTIDIKATWQSGRLRITVEGPDDLARVKAVVAWAPPVTLVKTKPGTFVIELEPPPGSTGKVTVVAFDKAHNRAESEVDVPPRP